MMSGLLNLYVLEFGLKKKKKKKNRGYKTQLVYIQIHMIETCMNEGFTVLPMH